MCIRVLGRVNLMNGNISELLYYIVRIFIYGVELFYRRLLGIVGENFCVFIYVWCYENLII